jgi:hypothetical protein
MYILLLQILALSCYSLSIMSLILRQGAFTETLTQTTAESGIVGSHLKNNPSQK